MEVCGGCVAACLSVFQCRRKCVPRQSKPLRLGGTVMVSQYSVSGQESVMRATALVRPGVVIVARTCKSKYVSTSSLLFAGEQLSSLGKTSSRALVVAPRRSTANSRMLLFQCTKWWTHATSRKEGSPEGGAGTGTAAWAENGRQTEH